MNEQFWIGLITLPFAVMLVAVTWVILGYVNKLWRKLHTRLLLTVDPAQTAPLRTRQANAIGDALQRGNSVHLFSGFGWVLVWARDSEPAKTDDGEIA